MGISNEFFVGDKAKLAYFAGVKIYLPGVNHNV
jgi:hypothetical protein